MHPVQQAVQAAYAAFQQGNLDEARRLLSGVEHVKAVHLLALVEKSAGARDAAAELFAKAARMDARDPEVANNRAILARDMGLQALAEEEYRRALEINPTFQQASTGLGRLLIDAERWQDALDVYTPLLSRDPGNVTALYGLATAKLGIGDAEEAQEIFDRLIKQGNVQPQIRFMRARALLELGEIEPALEDLKVSHAESPSDFTVRTLAGTYWMQGDDENFMRVLEESAAIPQLAVTSAEILRQSGDPRRAVDVLAAARGRAQLPIESWSVEATSHIDVGDAAAAEAACRNCLAEQPENRLILGSLITSLLMQGKAGEAMEFITRMRQEEPDRQHWIAYEATALRSLDPERYHSIVDIDRHVRPYTLPVPEGFASLAAFNEALLEALEPWHPYAAHPLDQSLRGGTQTTRDLTTIDDPVIKAFYRALDIPIRQYMADIGNAPDHPLTARNSGNYRITGAWSVKLRGGGRHVNHVHPEGWISSAYYVAVPEETTSGRGRGGWIKFGEPPFETIPPSPPEKWIQPSAGTLVLFPSYLWHGTHPIEDDALRVTAPFDAVPA